MRTLTRREQLFVAEYQKDLNATAAAIRAGYSKNSAESCGSRLLARPEVKAAVAVKIEKRLTKADITADRTILEIARIAYLDPAEFFYPAEHEQAGKLRPITDLEEDVRRCIHSIEWAQANLDKTDGKKSAEWLHKHKFYDKVKALELLAKHFALLKDVVEVQTDWDKISARLTSVRTEPARDYKTYLADLDKASSKAGKK
jgi:phage terminase small subunit